MQKDEILKSIVAHFQHEWEVTLDAARHIYEAATHEDARAENKYDTRGLEASYLAESQSKRALDLQQTINIYKSMPARTFGEDDTIAPGAHVVMEDEEGVQRSYFLGPRGGGSQIPCGDSSVTIITPASPLGKQMMGAEVGDELTLGEGSQKKIWEITELS